MKLLSQKIFMLLLGAGTMVAGSISEVHAQVYVSIGHWDYNQQAVTYIIQNPDTGGYTFGTEDFTKDTLPNEWSASDPYEALLSGALLIRTGAYYYYNNPQSADGSLTNLSGRPFNFRDSTYLGWTIDSQYNTNNTTTNNATNATVGRVIYQNGSQVYIPFNDCVQLASDNLANEGYDHTAIITSSSVGLYSATSKYGCNSQYEPYMPNLGFVTGYY